ncbi:MAG: hypothetical protein ACTSYQ_01530, partial [Candidatus Odinarchaeia archaeon]
MKKAKLSILSVAILASLSLLAVTPALTQPVLPNFQNYIGHNFNEHYWSTVTDWGPAINDFLNQNGMSELSNFHINTYNVYINQLGYQLGYIGFINWSIDIAGNTIDGTIPSQAIIQHFRSPAGKDVFILTEFYTLLAYNDTGSVDGLPDENDSLWASASFSATAMDPTFDADPELRNAMNSFSVETYPLVKSSDNNTWQWGMRYNNLTSVWWDVTLNDTNSNGIKAVALYDGLTFNYTLTFHPENNTVALSTSYEIGQPTKLWVFDWAWTQILPGIWRWVPTINIYNTTSTPTVTEWLQQQGLSMSILTFHKPVIIGYTNTFQVANNGTHVSPNNFGLINATLALISGNERIFDTKFETKPTYDLYDSATDTYNETGLEAKTAIHPVATFAYNKVLGSMHRWVFWPVHMTAYVLYPR